MTSSEEPQFKQIEPLKRPSFWRNIGNSMMLSLAVHAGSAAITTGVSYLGGRWVNNAFKFYTGFTDDVYLDADRVGAELAKRYQTEKDKSAFQKHYDRVVRNAQNFMKNQGSISKTFSESVMGLYLNKTKLDMAIWGDVSSFYGGFILSLLLYMVLLKKRIDGMLKFIATAGKQSAEQKTLYGKMNEMIAAVNLSQRVLFLMLQRNTDGAKLSPGDLKLLERLSQQGDAASKELEKISGKE